MLQIGEAAQVSQARPSRHERNRRWPTAYAAVLVTAVSLGLWALLLVGARWLTG